MNAVASECSSGCESGWTLYLEHSFLNQNAKPRGSTRFMDGNEGFHEEHKDKRAEDEDEDLSMVSDASSGPPHFLDEEAYFNVDDYKGCFYSASKAAKVAKNGIKRQKVKENQHLEDQHLPSSLYDTASSPFFEFSMNNVSVSNPQTTSTESMLDYSQGFSATYFEGRTSFQDHFSILQPSVSRK